MQFCIKVVILNRSYSTNGNQYENDNIPQKPENLRVSPIIFFFLALLIDIIVNIITYSTYSPYYFTRKSANGSAVSLSRDTDGNCILHCHV